MRAQYQFQTASTRFLVVSLHKAWRRSIGKPRYVASDDSGTYLSSYRCIYSDATSVSDDTKMLWPPALAGSAGIRKVHKFGYVLNYILSVNAAFGFDIEFPHIPTTFRNVVDSVLGDGVDLNMSSYSSGTPSNLSFWLAEYGLKTRAIDGLEDVSDGSFETPIANDDLSSDISIRICSSISDDSDSKFDEDILHLDVKRFGNIDNFRSDPEFHKICLLKFAKFTQPVEFRPFVMTNEREKVSISSLKAHIFDAPFLISNLAAPAFRFWLCAWWRFLYGELYSIMEFLAFGGMTKREKDMFRIASKIGPAEFHYMVPVVFLRLNDVFDAVDWNRYTSFVDLYSSVHIR